jgi:hypothetical protein
MYEQNQEAEDTFKQVATFLEQIRGRNVVFMFGHPRTGKTTVLGTIIESMSQPSMGQFWIHGANGGVFAPGFELATRVQEQLKRKEFPSQSEHSVFQVLTRFQPFSGPELELLFLETSGENLINVAFRSEGKAGVATLQDFLTIKNLQLSFILLTSWQRAKEDDQLLNRFLSLLNDKRSDLAGRVILLVTQWDSFPNPEADFSAWARDSLPLTYNKIQLAGNTIFPFSVGEVDTLRGISHISALDTHAGQDLYAKIYEIYTGVSSVRPKNAKSWWRKLFGF